MPLTDEELAEIKREAKEAKVAAAKAQADLATTNANYSADMRTVSSWMEQQRQAAAQQAAPAPEPEDDDAPGMSETKVRKLIADTVNVPAARLGAGLFAQNQQVAQLTNPEYVKYKGEVDALVQRMVQANPETVSDPTLFKHATDVVRLQHLDEIVEERAKARAARPADDDYDGEVEEEEVVPAGASPAASASPSTRAPLVAPAGVPGRTAQRTKSRVVLDDDERKWAQRFKLSNEEFDNFGDPKYSPDVLGFKDKNGVVRERV